jgi:Big-like domain-containing protein
MLVAALALSLSLGLAPRADAFIYWASETGDSIGRAELNGTGTDQSFVENADGPCGDVAVDGAHIYWANYGNDTIGRANLNGSGVDQNFIAGTDPCQVAVDATHVYWGNYGNGTIGRANLDGTAAVQNFVTGATELGGLALTPTEVYWTNRGAVNTIGRAALSTPGSPNQSFVTGASSPTGMTVDATHVYWANQSIDTIGRAAISDPGSPNQSFVTTADVPCGIAVTPTHIFWSNNGPDTIGRAPLADPNGPDKNQSFVTGATDGCGLVLDALSTPSCQNTSASTEQPQVVAIALPCDSGGGTRTFSIASAPAHGEISAFSALTGNLTYTPNPDFHGTDSFTYRATNQAATSSAATATLELKASNEFSLGNAKKNKRRGTAKLTVNVSGPGELVLAKTNKVKGVNTRGAAAGSLEIQVKLKSKARKRLDDKGKLSVAVEVTFSPDGGDPATESAKIKLVKK